MAHEIGSLCALPGGQSLFIGSSSGVFFVNTVRRAFSQAAAKRQRSAPANSDARPSLSSLPSPEECIFGPPSSHVRPAQPHTAISSNPSALAELPSQLVTRELLITYFRTWHPLFPFLHGPTCLEELELLYVNDPTGQSAPKLGSTSIAITLQCLFNIAKLDRPDLPHLGSCRIDTEEQLLLVLSPISLQCDLASIQALLAAQLFFVATMCLHAASTTGGLILRSIYRSGLHRCPVRYANLSADERAMRKRLFWSAYCLDRFVSQSLGHPLGLHDSDIDVCKPDQVELHEPVPRTGPAQEGTSPAETLLHLPSNHPRRSHADEEERSARGPGVQFADDTEQREEVGADEGQEEVVEEYEEEQGEQEEARGPDGQERESRQESRVGGASGQSSATQLRSQNQSVQAQFIRYSRLVTRTIELFHKSIHVRSSSRRNVLFLKADIDAWANTLPTPSSVSANDSTGTSGLDRDLFFEIARQQLLLLVNRPALSLEPTSAEFRHAIQICIAAARSIIRLLEQLRIRDNLFWPGFMSSVWMSGLIMAFACQLRLHSISNAMSDISASLCILKAMTPRWTMAQNCHDVLSMFLESMRQAPRGLKRKRGSDSRPLDGFETPQARYTSHRGPSRRPSALRGTAERSQTLLDARGQDPRGNGSSDGLGWNVSTGVPAPSAESNPFPILYQGDRPHNIPFDANVYDSTQVPEGADGVGLFSSYNTRNEWASHPDSAADFDIFNGTSWGPLMELVDNNY